MIKEAILEIKDIKALLGKSFFIPKYQRGYRWKKKPHVEDLLDDIWEFFNKQNKTEKEWYCLQPIVVIEKQNGKDIVYEVVDGQQRLTTIFLILKYLKIDNFKITYDTRKMSEEFLSSINSDNKTQKKPEDNIDFFHIYDAYTHIEEWFSDDNKLDKKKQFSEKLLCSVKVIWYKIASIDDNVTNAIDIFTRINIGKIPLTNAELIKALFLNSSNFKNKDPEKIRLKQLEIANKWDIIEYALQDDKFWYFINTSDNSLTSHIEFIFNLMEEINGKKDTDDPYSTFRFFLNTLKDNTETCWNEIKKYFQTLDDWFHDRELYYKIGYLITTETPMKDLIKANDSKSKTDFKKYLNEKISEKLKLKLKNEDIDTIFYENKTKNRIKEILLLHNILTVLKNESICFPFDRYKKEQWSIEHIHARHSKEITQYKDFKAWIKNIDKEALSELDQNLNERIESIQEEDSKVQELVFDIEGHLGDDPDDNSIGNLSLLSCRVNSKLSNNLFMIKRKRIFELEKEEGYFIPICTRKVFQIDEYKSCSIIKWTKEYREVYLKDIKNVLSEYL